MALHRRSVAFAHSMQTCLQERPETLWGYTIYACMQRNLSTQPLPGARTVDLMNLKSGYLRQSSEKQ